MAPRSMRTLSAAGIKSESAWRCSVCSQVLSKNFISIKCNGCGKWCHQKRCSDLESHRDWTPTYKAPCCAAASNSLQLRKHLALPVGPNANKHVITRYIIGDIKYELKIAKIVLHRIDSDPHYTKLCGILSIAEECKDEFAYKDAIHAAPSVSNYREELHLGSLKTEQLDINDEKKFMKTEDEHYRDDFTFVSQNRMENNMRVAMEGKFHVCDVCEKQCKTKAGLIRHLTIHRTNRIRRWRCDICVESFVTRRELETHNRTHPEDIRRKRRSSDARSDVISNVADPNMQSDETKNSLQVDRWTQTRRILANLLMETMTEEEILKEIDRLQSKLNRIHEAKKARKLQSSNGLAVDVGSVNVSSAQEGEANRIVTSTGEIFEEEGLREEIEREEEGPNDSVGESLHEDGNTHTGQEDRNTGENLQAKSKEASEKEDDANSTQSNYVSDILEAYRKPRVGYVTPSVHKSKARPVFRRKKTGSKMMYNKITVKEEIDDEIFIIEEILYTTGKNLESCKSGKEKRIQRNAIGASSPVKESAVVLLNRNGVTTEKTRIVSPSRSNHAFLCPEPECGRRFKSRRNQLAHKRAHGPKRYFCAECNAGFTYRDGLVNHIRTHGGLKPYKCDICGHKTTTKTALNHHLTTHSGVRPFKCSICGLAFTWRNVLSAHLRIHTGERPFECNVCGKKFAHAPSLKSHSFTHSGIKQFECHMCDARYSRKASLEIHLNIHLGVKPFKCTQCDCSYVHKSYLVRHSLTHEKKVVFHCEKCERVFKKKYFYLKHVERDH